MFDRKRFIFGVLMITVVSLLAAITGCEKIVNLLSFNVKNESNFQVSSTVPLNTPIDITTPDIATQSEEEFANNKTKASLVRDVRLSEMTLEITGPQGKTFSFLKSIHIYISTSENKDEVEMAFIENIDPNASTINLTPINVKLDNYIKASSYILRTKVVTREVITENIDINAKSTFRVTANLR